MISANYVDGLELRIKELTAERNNVLAQNSELVAQVDQLKELARFWIAQSEPRNASKQEYNTWLALGHNSTVMAATPTQHLRDRDAEAGRAGFVAGCEYAGDGFCSIPDAQAADQYAEKVRRGEV